MDNSSTDSIVYSEKDPKFIKLKLLNAFRKNLKIIIIFLCLFLIAVVITIIGIKQGENQKIIENAKINIIKNGGLRNIYNEKVGFTGVIKEIGNDYFILNGGGETKRILLSDKTQYVQFPWVYDGNLDRRLKKPLEKITFDSLVVGEYMDVVGTLDTDKLNAQLIMVFRQGAK